MAPHSSTLAWKIPWTEEPVRLQSMGSLRVGHDWATSLSLFTFMHWRRKWQPTPVFLPGESQGWGYNNTCTYFNIPLFYSLGKFQFFIPFCQSDWLKCLRLVWIDGKSKISGRHIVLTWLLLRDNSLVDLKYLFKWITTLEDRNIVSL